MKRRDFLKTSLASSVLAGLGAPGGLSAATVPGAAGERLNGREYYEVRTYRLKSGADGNLLHGYLEKALIPGLNRFGIRPVGAFTEQGKPDMAVYLLIPYPSLLVYQDVVAGLQYDQPHGRAGKAYLRAPKEKAVLEGMESELLLAFSGMPKLRLPAHCRERLPSRIFELRRYESFSETKAAQKVRMFDSGEIEIMRDVELAPVFYGRGLIGGNLPHLTYLTSGENEQAHQKHWEAFGKDPRWLKLKDDPQYADTVSRISKWMWLPTSYSQI